MRTLLSGGIVVTCNTDHTVHAPGDVLMQDDRITWVGASYSGDYDVRISVTGRIVMPGLINAHTHSPMTLLRSLSDDVDLMVFLHERAWPREVRLTSEDVYWGSLLAGIEMLKSGVTTFVDMYFWEEDIARAVEDLGIRAVITPGILQSPAWEPLLGSWEKRTQSVLDFCRRWNGRFGRIHVGLGPHAPYTLPIEALSEIAQESRSAGLPLHIHLVETEAERSGFNAQGRGSTAAVLDEIGLFDGNVIAAHSVWLDDGDVDIYARHGVGVAHCPQSNAKLGAGIAPLQEMLAAGVRVGIGTDGAATNNNLNLWEELRLAPLLAKARALDPKPVSSREALWMATRMGAQAIHQPEIGVLAVGQKADIVTIGLDDTTAVPIFQPETYIDHLVYSMGRESVDSVWVNGALLVTGGEVLSVDETAVRRAAQQAATALSVRAGL